MKRSAFSLDSIKPLAGRALQEALNRALALDPSSVEKLSTLEGRRIEAHLQSPEIALALVVCAGRFEVGPINPEVEPDISVKTRLSGLLQSLPLFAQGRTAVGAMRISGDVELARLLQDLVKEFDPDWQEPFIRLFGPIVGPQAAKFIGHALQQARLAAGNLAHSGAEYVTEEARVVVSKSELRDFYKDVDLLRLRADRLQARADQLRVQQP